MAEDKISLNGLLKDSPQRGGFRRLGGPKKGVAQRGQELGKKFMSRMEKAKGC